MITAEILPQEGIVRLWEDEECGDVHVRHLYGILATHVKNILLIGGRFLITTRPLPACVWVDQIQKGAPPVKEGVLTIDLSECESAEAAIRELTRATMEAGNAY